jgi:Fe-S-cluster-containing dehydrogenase component
MAVCPTDAIKKRKEDGIVYVEARLCVGCKACIDACHPQWEESNGKVKMRRLQGAYRGRRKNPRRDGMCMAHALNFGKPNTGTRKTRQCYTKSLFEKKRWLQLNIAFISAHRALKRQWGGHEKNPAPFVRTQQ